LSHAQLTFLGYELCRRYFGVHSSVPVRRRSVERTDKK
jgi:hypothetical protein